jgi:3-oxoadipate enol-lactonase
MSLRLSGKPQRSLRLDRKAIALMIAGMSAAGGIGLLAVMPPPSASPFVQVPDSKLFYQECGSGSDAVVLIHDGVVDSAVWNDVWPTLCEQFHVIRYDRRGFGRSPAATSWYSEVDDLAAILRTTRVKRATLIGSSHGGEISIDFALAHPELVKRLVLVGAVVSGFPYSEHFIVRGSSIFELIRKGDVPNGLETLANDRYLIAPGNNGARRKLIDLLTANPQDATHPDRAIPPKPAFPRLNEIRIPTLILVGEADIPDVHAHAGAIEAGIPNARRVVVSGTGHLMYLEKPEEFSRIVLNFIETNKDLPADPISPSPTVGLQHN